MTYRQRLSRLEAKSDLRHPKEQKLILLNFIGPDGPEDAGFATTLDADPLRFHRRPEETVAMFKERVCDELRVRDEHNAAEESHAANHISMHFRKVDQSIRFVSSANVDTTHSQSRRTVACALSAAPPTKPTVRPAMLASEFDDRGRAPWHEVLQELKKCAARRKTDPQQQAIAGLPISDAQQGTCQAIGERMLHLTGHACMRSQGARHER